MGQVAAPVRWDLCMAAMSDLGVTGLLEMPPAGTLTGIAKRNLKGVELFALNTPDQLEEAMEFVQKHGGAASASPIAGNPTWRLIVSPGKGQFVRTEDIEADTILPNHSTVGMVKNLRDEIAGQRASRWHRRRVAGRGWGSRLPWSAAASAASRLSNPQTQPRSPDDAQSDTRGQILRHPRQWVAIGRVAWSTTPRSAR